MNRAIGTMRLPRGRLFALALAIGLLLAGSGLVQAQDRAPTADGPTPPPLGLGDPKAVGQARATYGECPTGSDSVFLSGEDVDGVWSLAYVVVTYCHQYSSEGVAFGAWDPQAGGCLMLPPEDTLCLRNPREVAPGVFDYDYDNTYEIHSGLATLVFP